MASIYITVFGIVNSTASLREFRTWLIVTAFSTYEIRFGDTVNVASRMESTGERKTIK